MSCGRNPRHIDIRYCFAKDRVDVYCPTEQILADFFTKPLQGYLTRRLKAVLIGHAHISTVLETPSATVQERVESEDFGETIIGHEQTGMGLMRMKLGLMWIKFPRPHKRKMILDRTQPLCVEPRDL